MSNFCTSTTPPSSAPPLVSFPLLWPRFVLPPKSLSFSFPILPSSSYFSLKFAIQMQSSWKYCHCLSFHLSCSVSTFLHLLFAFSFCSTSGDQNPQTNHMIMEWYTMLVPTFHNITQQTFLALKQFQCQQCRTGRNNSTNHCLFMQSWSEPFLFYKPAIFSLLPNISLCCSFHTSTMKSMQNWSDSICKPVISILNLARTSLQTRDLHSSSFIYHISYMWCSF